MADGILKVNCFKIVKCEKVRVPIFMYTKIQY